METKNELSEGIKKQLETWHTKYDELELQMHLGKKEAADKFEEHKDTFLSWIGDLKKKIGEQSDEKSLQLKQNLDELKLQAALGKMEAGDKFDDYKQKLDKTIDKTIAYCQEAADVDTFSFENLADSFKNKMEIFKQQALGKINASDEETDQTDAEKNELENNLAKLKDKMEDMKEAGEEKWEQGKEFIDETFKNLGDRFKKFF